MAHGTFAHSNQEEVEMLQPLIIDAGGIAHGVTKGNTRPNQGLPRYDVTMSWCGTSLQEWIRLEGFYSSAVHQQGGYDPRTSITCLACLSEGP